MYHTAPLSRAVLKTMVRKPWFKTGIIIFMLDQKLIRVSVDLLICWFNEQINQQINPEGVLSVG